MALKKLLNVKLDN